MTRAKRAAQRRTRRTLGSNRRIDYLEFSRKLVSRKEDEL